ncbi:MAG: LPS export ABC transporter periplasmic protein LptC [Rhodobacteraceae bacterium]|nr:LPS export ABC transporter periplasmic protein LptC [Paracoccaceae bacterium]
MALPADIYARLVAWSRIVLPLLALGLLSSLFLFPRTGDPLRNEVFSPADRAEMLRDERIAQPRISLVAEDGTAIELRAEEARPLDAETGAFRAFGLSGVVLGRGGQRLELEAAEAMIEAGAERAELGGGVVLHSETGHRLVTSGLSAALDRLELVSTGAVEVDGPEGRLSAGGMEVRLADEGRGAQLLVFTGGVKLIYEPGNGFPE